MNRYAMSLVLGVSLAVTAACSSGSSSNPAAASSTTTTAAPSMNLAGSWSGKLNNVNSNGGQGQSNPPNVTWSAGQTGSTVTGPITLTFSDNDGQPHTYVGTLTGTLSGTQLSLALSLPSGSFPESPACSVSGSGTATPTTSSISSTLAIVFSQACIGTVGDHPTETDQLTLSK